MLDAFSTFKSFMEWVSTLVCIIKVAPVSFVQIRIRERPLLNRVFELGNRSRSYFNMDCALIKRKRKIRT